MANKSMFPAISADNEENSPMSVESLCMACEEMVGARGKQTFHEPPNPQNRDTSRFSQAKVKRNFDNSFTDNLCIFWTFITQT
jgi:hypothetical protein